MVLNRRRVYIFFAHKRSNSTQLIYSQQENNKLNINLTLTFLADISPYWTKNWKKISLS